MPWRRYEMRGLPAASWNSARERHELSHAAGDFEDLLLSWKIFG